MVRPVVTEVPRALEPVDHDVFGDEFELAAARRGRRPPRRRSIFRSLGLPAIARTAPTAHDIGGGPGWRPWS